MIHDLSSFLYYYCLDPVVERKNGPGVGTGGTGIGEICPRL